MGVAYAQVIAKATTDAEGGRFCANSVHLFYSADGKRYAKIYSEARENGLGVRLVGWSPDGDKLLVELRKWGYDSDAINVGLALVFDASSRQIRNIHLYEKFERLFGKSCEFDVSPVAWQEESSILVRVTRTAFADYYDQKFCVSHPTQYVWNFQTETLTHLASEKH
jgi:hypothetical protein